MLWYKNHINKKKKQNGDILFHSIQKNSSNKYINTPNVVMA